MCQLIDELIMLIETVESIVKMLYMDIDKFQVENFQLRNKITKKKCNQNVREVRKSVPLIEDPAKMRIIQYNRLFTKKNLKKNVKKCFKYVRHEHIQNTFKN